MDSVRVAGRDATGTGTGTGTGTALELGVTMLSDVTNRP
jgi:hypothetical protein